MIKVTGTSTNKGCEVTTHSSQFSLKNFVAIHCKPVSETQELQSFEIMKDFSHAHNLQSALRIQPNQGLCQTIQRCMCKCPPWKKQPKASGNGANVENSPPPPSQVGHNLEEILERRIMRGVD